MTKVVSMIQNADSAIQVQTGDRAWLLERSGNLEDLWNAMGEDGDPDEHIPYWAELWPSSLLLAQWLERRQGEISGRLCLDLGCGLGLTTLAGKSLGAHMLGVDNEMEALECCRKNAVVNHVSQPEWLAMDWRYPALRPHVVWRLWAADIMYEQRFADPLLKFINLVLANDGKAWIAEPGRKIFDTFLKAADGQGWKFRCVAKENLPSYYNQAPDITARIWELAH